MSSYTQRKNLGGLSIITTKNSISITDDSFDSPHHYRETIVSNVIDDGEYESYHPRRRRRHLIRNSLKRLREDNVVRTADDVAEYP